jgi:hypothetical protein
MQREKGCMMSDKPKIADPQVVFTCPQSLIAKADHLAEREMISRSALIRRLLAERLRRVEPECA